jgi:serine/threonine protein phosphatase 1
MELSTRIQGPVAVIGDIHGQTDKLLSLLEKLRQLPDYDERWLVFIGDFVDRGPDPKGAVDLFLNLARKHPKTTAICGNHEYAMAASLGWIPSPDAHAWAERWTEFYDAQPTFESYGVEAGKLDELAAAVPPPHRELLARLPWCVEHPMFLFVHAGLDPLAPYDVQLRILHRKDFTLNRPQWLFSKSYVDADPPKDCPLVVVSGHVRVPHVVVRAQRILVDTTGGEGGDLSCVLLPEKTIVSSAPGSGPVAATIGEKPAKKWWRLFG